MVAWLVEVKFVATSVVMLAEVDPSVVIVALVEVSVVTVAEVTVAFVSDKLLMVRLPTRATVNDASAQVRLLGFVPSSITALAEVMENIRLSAVLTATSAPPAKLVRLAVPGTDPGVSLFFNRIVGISRCLRSNCLWR